MAFTGTNTCIVRWLHSAFAFFFADIIFCQYAYTVFLLLQVPTSVNKYSIVCLHKIKENAVVLLQIIKTMLCNYLQQNLLILSTYNDQMK